MQYDSSVSDLGTHQKPAHIATRSKSYSAHDDDYDTGRSNKGMSEDEFFDDEHDSFDDSDAEKEIHPSRGSRLIKIAAAVGIFAGSVFAFLTTPNSDEVNADEVDAAGQLINQKGHDVHVVGYHAPPANHVETAAGYIPPQRSTDVAAYIPPPNGNATAQATASAKAAQ
jgi:hypothetical protein